MDRQDTASGDPHLALLVERGYRKHRRTPFDRLLSRLRWFARVAEVGRETLAAWPIDRREAALPAAARLLDTFEGSAVAAADAVLLYAHYMPSGRVTPMVFRQLEAYAEEGFTIFFISMSHAIRASDLERLRSLCRLIVRRRSFGRDFGAWADLWPRLRRDFPAAREVLLANDSILGPIRPLAPLFRRLRQREGLLGLTESVGGGVHLQSYLLLLRGTAAITEADRFFAALRLSANKWTMIQRGEIGLTRHMLAAGIPVLAAYGYDETETLALSDPAQRSVLWSVMPSLFPNFRANDTAPTRVGDLQIARRTLFRSPINPTHHFWSALIRLQDFPFIKTELLIKNPAGMPDVIDWRDLVPPESPVSVDEMDEHLTEFARPRPRT